MDDSGFGDFEKELGAKQVSEPDDVEEIDLESDDDEAAPDQASNQLTLLPTRRGEILDEGATQPIADDKPEVR